MILPDQRLGCLGLDSVCSCWRYDVRGLQYKATAILHVQGTTLCHL